MKLTFLPRKLMLKCILDFETLSFNALCLGDSKAINSTLFKRH